MNKPRSTNRSERGQVLVLIVLAVVGLFGFGALALDVGQVYYARRSAQAAADAAVMAAVYEAANMPRIENEENYSVPELQQLEAVKKRTAAGKLVAEKVARLNGFNNDVSPDTVGVFNPPATGPYCGTCSQAHAMDYWQVKVSVILKPIFGHLIFSGFQHVSVEATARAESVDESTAGDAFVSLSKGAKSMLFNGNIKVNVSGGNIRSLGEMYRNGGGNGDNDGNKDPAAITVTEGGKIYYGVSIGGKTNLMSPAPVKNVVTDYGSFEAPYCPAKDEAKTANGWEDKGSYFSKTLGSNSTPYFVHPAGLQILELPKGIHCVYGDTKVNGGKKGLLTGTGVLIVVMDGDVEVTGNGSVNLKASKNLMDANGNTFGGMLMYIPASNAGTIKLGGNSDDYFYGMIYAPKTACNIGGTSDTTAYHTAIICDTLKTHGDATVSIVYKAEELFRLPPRVELIH